MSTERESPFVEQVRATAQRAKQEHERKAAEERTLKELKLQELKRRMEEDARAQYPGIKENIIEAVSSRLVDYFDVTVYRWEDQPPEWAQFREDELTKLLKADGFNVAQKYYVEKPVGSDPMFPNTVYSLDLRVTW